MLYGTPLCALETSSTPETPYLERRRRTSLDAKTLPCTHLDTWAGLQATTAHGRPRISAAPVLETQDLRRRRRRARFRRDAPINRPIRTLGTRKKTMTAGPRLAPPGDDKYMPTSYIWDSGQEITGVQGVVAGGVQLTLFDRCRRRWRRLVAGAVAVRGKGKGASTEQGGGVRLLPQSE